MMLVLGGAGQLGSELVRAASMRGIAVAAPSRSALDINDAPSVMRVLGETNPGFVVNAAGYTKVDQAEKEPEAARLGNSAGPAIVAAACEKAGIPLIHISTDYVFDGRKVGPYVETDATAPLGVYGRSKAAGEAAVRATTGRHVIVRAAWLYGEFGQNFLKTIIRRASKRDELRVVADQRGCPTSTRDLADAILRIAPRLNERAPDAPIYGTFHFAGRGSATWYEFATRIVEGLAVSGCHRSKVTPIATADYPAAARRPPNSMLDCQRFIDTFGIAPRRWQEEADELTDIVSKKILSSESYHVA